MNRKIKHKKKSCSIELNINFKNEIIMDVLYNIEEYMLRATEHLYDYEILKAKRLLEDVLEKDPEHAMAHMYLGCIYAYRLNDREKALMHLRNAICSDVQCADAHINYIKLLIEAGKYADAIKCINYALQHLNNNLEYIYELQGETLELLGSNKAAIKAYKQAIKQSVNDASIATMKSSIMRVKNKINKKPKKNVKIQVTNPYFSQSIVQE